MAVGKVAEEVECPKCHNGFWHENPEYEWEPDGIPTSDSFEGEEDCDCPVCGIQFTTTVNVYIGRD